jgi:hypothetical protein
MTHRKITVRPLHKYIGFVPNRNTKNGKPAIKEEEGMFFS